MLINRTMSILYIMLAPLFGKVFYDRVRMISRSFQQKDRDGIKVNAFFLMLILVVGAGLVVLI